MENEILIQNLDLISANLNLIIESLNLITENLSVVIQILKFNFLFFGIVFACFLVSLFAKAWVKNG